jgi:hypothetical protein
MIDGLKYHRENIWENKVCGFRFLPAKWYTITCKDPELPRRERVGFKGQEPVYQSSSKNSTYRDEGGV